MKKNTKTITFRHAAAELRVSDSTILRLVQRGALHATRPELVKSHWTRRIVLDRSFQDERARRLNGLRAPRRKPIPNPNPNLNRELSPADPSPNQTVTPPAAPQPPFIVDAREYLVHLHYKYGWPVLFLNANRAMFNFDGEAELLDRLAARTEAAADFVMTSAAEWEERNTRCTAVAATACILLILLAAYLTLCHFNII